MIHSTRFQEAIRRFDEANSKDIHQEIWQGQSFPKELLYARRMSECLAQFAPDASEALQLAVRCQHICRWEIPRSDFPMDRKGYNQWRSHLQVFHADKAATILREVGYDEEIIKRVKFLLLKKQLKRDAETQTLEDVICLVFLKYYFDDFARKHPEEKLIEILQKTWTKMSASGQEAAIQLSLSAHAF
ncbi:MAG: DUF4202 domain-containing protein, partial [Bacteroidia bacterium]|nr:DUF4202 domain-containing protein [Bacteroidia bacterium]